MHSLIDEGRKVEVGRSHPITRPGKEQQIQNGNINVFHLSAYQSS